MKNEHDLVQGLLAHDEDLVVPPDHERRIREGLGALLGAMPAVPAPPADAPAPSPPAPSPPAPSPPADAVGAVAGSALRKWIATGVIAALAAGGGFVAGRATAPAAVAPASASVSTPNAQLVPTSAPPATPATSAEPVATAPAASAPPSASVTRSPPQATAAPASDAFDREQSLLERARSALVRHDASAAENALDEHDRQFPRSRHAEERDYLRIQVLRERGDDARVRERAKAFLVKYPQSMLRARVEPLAQ